MYNAYWTCVYNIVYYLKQEYEHWRRSYKMHEDDKKFRSCMWRVKTRKSAKK
jgi:hypothetical protein